MSVELYLAYVVACFVITIIPGPTVTLIVANSLTSQYTITFVRPGGGNPKTTKIETSKGAKVLLTPWMR